MLMKWFMALCVIFPSIVFSVDDVQRKLVQKALISQFPQMTIDKISASPIKGVLEVQAGLNFFYISADGAYLLKGSLIELSSGKNLTLEHQNSVKKYLLTQLNESQMLVYEPEQRKHQITLVTDIDSAYGRKLHKEMSEYLNYGIRIRYLFYPRAGKKSLSYTKAVSVWCDKNPKKALDLVMSGKTIEPQVCVHPILAHMEFVESLGIHEAPVMILDSGRPIPGYLAAEQLSLYLDSLLRKEASVVPPSAENTQDSRLNNIQ